VPALSLVGGKCDRPSRGAWNCVGCVAGALSDQEYLTKLAAAGFENPDIEVTRVYTVEDARDFWAGQSADIKQLARQVDGKFVSGFIRAVKPATDPAGADVLGSASRQSESSACCASTCCGRES